MAAIVALTSRASAGDGKRGSCRQRRVSGADAALPCVLITDSSSRRENITRCITVSFVLFLEHCSYHLRATSTPPFKSLIAENNGPLLVHKKCVRRAKSRNIALQQVRKSARGSCSVMRQIR